MHIIDKFIFTKIRIYFKEYKILDCQKESSTPAKKVSVFVFNFVNFEKLIS